MANLDPSRFESYDPDPVGVLETFRDLSPGDGFDAVIEVLGDMVDEGGGQVVADFAARMANAAIRRLATDDDRTAASDMNDLDEAMADLDDTFGRLAA